MAGLVLTHQEAGVVFDFLFGKNEAIRGRIPWDSFVLVEFEEGGGVAELAAFAGLAAGLDFAESGQRVLELAREACGLEVEAGEEAVGLEDGEGVVAGDEAGFEERDAAEAPGGIGELVDKVRFGGIGGLVFVEELAAVGFEGGGVFGGEDGRGGGKAVTEGVAGGAEFAFRGAGAGGVLGVQTVDGWDG